jgi:hypothetical protein
MYSFCDPVHEDAVMDGILSATETLSGLKIAGGGGGKSPGLKVVAFET